MLPFVGLAQANDGGVVYLNGNELLRWNVPTGALAFNTLATALGEKVKWMQYLQVRAGCPVQIVCGCFPHTVSSPTTAIFPGVTV